MNTSAETDAFYGLGIILVFVGITMMLLAVLRLFFPGNKSNGKTGDGGIVVIGSVPIVFAIEQGINGKDSVAGTQPYSSLHNHNYRSLLFGAKLNRNLKGIFKEDVDACSGSEGYNAPETGNAFHRILRYAYRGTASGRHNSTVEL